MGHTKEKLETAQYGQNRSQLELRKDVIEAIEFPNVDFEAMNWNDQNKTTKLGVLETFSD